MEYSEEIYYIDSLALEAPFLLGQYLNTLLFEYETDPVFLCIGSDRVTGDALGPLVGSRLAQYEAHPPCGSKKTGIEVYGTLALPVHALNLNEILHHIREYHPDNPVVAIDASLGVRDHVGYLTVGKGSLSPGAGVNKNLANAGDIFITGIVGPAGPFSHFTLQTTRLSTVISMAETITKGILVQRFVSPSSPVTNQSREVFSPVRRSAPAPSGTCSDSPAEASDSLEWLSQNNSPLSRRLRSIYR